MSGRSMVGVRPPVCQNCGQKTGTVKVRVGALEYRYCADCAPPKESR